MPASPVQIAIYFRVGVRLFTGSVEEKIVLMGLEYLYNDNHDNTNNNNHKNNTHNNNHNHNYNHTEIRNETQGLNHSSFQF